MEMSMDMYYIQYMANNPDTAEETTAKMLKIVNNWPYLKGM